MHLSPSIVIYTLIIIKFPKNCCQNIDKFNLPAPIESSPQNQNFNGLTQNSFREPNNESIFDANYVKVPPELSDPTFGIVNYDAKKDINSSEESILERMKAIDLEAEKYATIFSKAFATGYSAARFENFKQQQQQQQQMANASTKTRQASRRSVFKAIGNLNNSALLYEYDIGDALASNKKHMKKKKNTSKSSGNLPFNITSDAVGYGAAYASGYALAAADRIIRLGKYNYSEVQPWKMDNAAAAGFAAYYAGAIAKSRAVRQPVVVGIMPQQKHDNRKTVRKHEGGRSRIDADLAIQDKKTRNIEIYKPAEEGRDDTIQNLILNIDENPQGDKGTISNIASPNKSNRSLNGKKDNEDVVTKIIIKDVNVKNNIAEKNNEDLTLDIDPSSLNKKRSLFDEEANNIGVNGAEDLKNYARYQKRHDQGSNVLENRRQISEETDSALVGTDEEKLIRPLVLPLKHLRKRKRSGKCVKHRYGREKKKKMNAIINC